MTKTIFFHFLLFLIVFCGATHAQTTVLFEDFESGGALFTQSGDDTWNQNTSIYFSNSNSFHLAYTSGSNTILVLSTAIDLTSYTGALLDFYHIAKVEVSDTCWVQISSDNGSTWDTLASKEYYGQGFLLNDLNFFDGSYPEWEYNINTVPDNSWWKKETFNISKYTGVGNSQVKIRFVLKSDNLLSWYGWLLDDIKVTGVTSGEFDPPAIEHYSLTNTGSPNSRNVYAIIQDSSGIDSAMVYYRIDGGSWIGPNVMTIIAGDEYKFAIPGQMPGTTIDYYLKAVDATSYRNTAYHPSNEPVNYHTYDVVSAIYEFPYFEGFEGASAAQWTHKDDLTVGNTGVHPVDDWDLGHPNKNHFRHPYEGDKAYVTQLYSWYSYNSRSSLISPLFDLKNVVNPSISFYHVLDCLSNSDGGRIDYTLDEGVTWHVLGQPNNPASSNWYNKYALGSASTPVSRPGWSAWRSPWANSSYDLTGIGWPDYFIRFRFAFTSSSSSGDGWMIDNVRVGGSTGVSEVSKPTHLQLIHLYPIPSNGTMHISYFLSEKSVDGVRIFNTLGEVVHIFQLTYNTPGTHHETLHLEFLGSGLYLIQFTTKNTSVGEYFQILK